MSRVSNENVIVLKQQSVHMISNIKQRERDREGEREREQNLAKQFTLHSAEVFSEPFSTSKQEGYLIGGNYFRKNIHARCLKRF